MNLVVEKENNKQINIGDVVVFTNGTWGIILKYKISDREMYFVADVKSGFGGFVGESESLEGLVDKLKSNGENKIYSAKEFELILKRK